MKKRPLEYQMVITSYLVSDVPQIKSGYTVKYSMSPREMCPAPPSGFPLCSGYISPYILPLVIIQIQYQMYKICLHNPGL